jgi:hypothetical protein
MAYEFWSHCFALSVCGIACGLITAMDLQDSTDPADKNAGAWTIDCVLGLIFILMIIYMFRLGYSTNSNMFSNFAHNIVPAVFSIVLGINMYFSYYFKDDSVYRGKYITSLVCGIVNIFLVYGLLSRLANLPLEQHVVRGSTFFTKEIGNANWFLIFLLMVFVIISASLNINLSSDINSNNEIHEKSKSYYKGGNIALIVGLGLMVCYIILRKFESKHNPAAAAAAAAPAAQAAAVDL